MEQIKFQKIGERNTLRAVISGSCLLRSFSFAPSIFPFRIGAPSAAMPTLSGERFIPMHNGTPATRNSTLAKNAAQRQPNEWTAIPSSGVISAPPTGTAALTTVIARARKRMNQLLALAGY